MVRHHRGRFFYSLGSREEEPMTGNAGSHRRVWLGLFLIALGVLFLLDRFGYVYFSDFLETWWPTALILFGLFLLFSRRHRRVGFPLSVIALGLIFQGERLNWYGWWRIDRLWPLVLIAWGVGLLLGRIWPGTAAGSSSGSEPGGAAGSPPMKI